MTANPRISVLMSLYNTPEFLKQAIDSILNQSFGDFEFLIINDGCTDHCPDIVRSYKDPRIVLIDNEVNMGTTKSFNKGMHQARGEFMARMDPDDISHPERFAKQVAFMEANPEVAVLGTQIRPVDESGQPLQSAFWKKSCSWTAIRWQLIFDSPMVHSTTLFRKKVILEDFGGYNEDYPSSQDFELWSRVARQYKLANLPDCLMDFRIHTGSVSYGYKTENIKKVGDILRRNVQPYLEDKDEIEAWVEFWVRINNTRNLGMENHPKRLINMVYNIYHGYVRKYPEAASNPELFEHWANTLARIACTASRVSRWESLQLFWRACRIQSSAALPLWKSFLAGCVVGNSAGMRSWALGLRQKLSGR